jgi:5'(3')-deoxyribonucleotidase
LLFGTLKEIYEDNTLSVIALDMDGVLADLHSRWLELYNADWKDKLKPEDILSWDIHKYVKLQCGNRIYGYLDDIDLYDNVQPLPGALEVTEALTEAGHTLIVVTMAYHNPNMIASKIKWLKAHVPAIPKDHFIFCNEKRFVRADMLVDDNPAFLKDFDGDRLLMAAPHNKNYTNATMFRVNSLKDVQAYIEGSLRPVR